MSKHRKPIQQPPHERHSLVLTGWCASRHCVLWFGRPVWLASAEFEALCLLASRRPDAEGFVPLSRLVVYRLRKELARAGVPQGQCRLIARGPAKRYFLDLPVDQIAMTNATSTET